MKTPNHLECSIVQSTVLDFIVHFSSLLEAVDDFHVAHWSFKEQRQGMQLESQGLNLRWLGGDSDFGWR